MPSRSRLGGGIVEDAVRVRLQFPRGCGVQANRTRLPGHVFVGPRAWCRVRAWSSAAQQCSRRDRRRVMDRFRWQLARLPDRVRHHRLGLGRTWRVGFGRPPNRVTMPPVSALCSGAGDRVPKLDKMLDNRAAANLKSYRSSRRSRAKAATSVPARPGMSPTRRGECCRTLDYWELSRDDCSVR
jgi:hypothetical protein